MEITSFDRESVALAWEPPKSDGGNPVKGKCDSDSSIDNHVYSYYSLERPDAPKDVEIKEFDKRMTKLGWKPPLSDGGNKITGKKGVRVAFNLAFTLQAVRKQLRIDPRLSSAGFLLTAFLFSEVHCSEATCSADWSIELIT